MVLCCLATLPVSAQNSPTSPPSGTTGQTLPPPTPYQVVDQGANNNVWERTVYERAPDGSVVPKKHRYTELATGLNYLQNGQWVESKEVIETYSGGAIAQQGQYQVVFANNLNTTGSIDMQTPDGKQLRSNILGLSYYDSSTGQSVLIAQIQDSQGEFISANQVLYPNAFSGVKADVRYTYKKGSFEQDVILREQPPTPESLGLNSGTTEIQVLTEFINPPAIETVNRQGQAIEASYDQTVSWGTMRIGRGKAFELGQAQDLTDPTVVRKQYGTIAGRNILIEAVKMADINAELASLPLQSSLDIKLPTLASKTRQLPQTPLAQANNKPIKLATAKPSNKGYVLDYVELDTDTNDYTFQGDTTYLISGWINISGIGTFEGGTVVKYDTGQSSGIQVWGNAVCTGSSYRPAIFTSQNDDSVGEGLSVSGTPMNYDTALSVDASWSNMTLQNMRFSYCRNALHPTCVDFKLSNAQFMNCQYPFYPDAYWEFGGSGQMTCELNNILMADSNAAFGGSAYVVTASHVTVDNCSELTMTWEDPSDNSLALTNSLLTGVADDGPVPLVTDHTARPTGAVYQVVGAGSYYLTNGSPYRNYGTTNIDPADLANIATKTTYPPIIYSNTTISVATTFSPQVPRDTNASPDLGYHYDPLDYVFGDVNVSSNLTFTAGTSVGWFEADGNMTGIFLNDEGGLNFKGTVTTPCNFARYCMVQEGGNGNWTDKGYLGGVVFNGDNPANPPTMTASFTKWEIPAGGPNQFRDAGGYGLGGFSDCEFYGGNIGSYGSPYYFTNTLLFRVNTAFWDAASNTFQNCTFNGGGLALARYSGQSPSFWTVKNTAFDGTAFITMMDDNFAGDTNYTAFDYNAYNSANTNWPGYFGSDTTNRLETIGAHDLTVTNYNWQSSQFGNFYLPTNSPLINAGSTTADQVGLYHFTTQTNQVPETNSIVDIAYHYVATDAYGNPLDSNGDGIPDYLEDANGNGVVDGGETNWALAILVQPTSLLANVGTSPTFSVTAGGIAPFHYQWYSNSVAFGSATNATLTINNVQTNNAGNYYVIVTNAFGSVTSSTATLVVVVPPIVAITNPPNNTIFIASTTNITLTAIASDIAGTISQVQFFQGTTNLGIVTNSPYTLVWSNAPAGNFALAAVAIDNGLMGTSSIVNITIAPLFSTNNLYLWLKGDSISGLTNNAPIATWSDSSGWGNNATQTTTNNQPVYTTNSINGYPAVQFDGANDSFGLPFFMNQATGGEAFVVLKVATNYPGSPRGLWHMAGNGTYNTETYPDTGGNINEDFGISYGGGYDLGKPAQPLDQYHMYEVVSQTNDWRAWINGQLLYQATNGAVGFDSGPSLGSDGSYHFGGDIAEVLVFNRGLTDGERMTAKAYLNGKYGLVPPVPATPTNLMALPVSQTQISLTWNEILNQGATQISIERKTGTNAYTPVALIANADSYMDTNLTAGTTYYYRVRALNIAIWSAYSNETNATTLSSGSDFPFGNLKLWLRADTGLAQNSTNTPVSLWADQSGNANHATQPSAANQPTWTPGALLNRPVIHFDGANDSFGLPYFMNAATGGEAFVVLKVTTSHPSSSHGLWYMGGYGVYDNETYPDTGGNINEDFGRANNGAYAIGIPAPPINQYHVYEVTSQTNDWRAWINGQLLYQTNINAVGFSHPVSLGADTYPFAGDMAEVLVFNRGLTDGERTTINQYLNNKYGMVPTVSITAPTNNAVFATGSNIGLAATASQPNGGTIKQVEYFQGSTSLGVSTNAPYSVTWNNALAGSSTTNIIALTARVTGSDGLVSTSSVVTIWVDPSPVISITNPPDYAALGIAPINVPISVAVSDVTGVMQVQYFAGTNSLGIVTNAPYSIIWSNAPVGIYPFTAVATGNDGLSTTSSVIHGIVDIDSDGDGSSDYQEYLYGTDPSITNGFWIWVSTPNNLSGFP